MTNESEPIGESLGIVTRASGPSHRGIRLHVSETDDRPPTQAAGGLVRGVSWCMFAPQKAPKTFATFEVVRCGNVRNCTTFHAQTTLFNHNGVQGSRVQIPSSRFKQMLIKDLQRPRSL